MAAPPSSAPGPAQVAPRAGLALALLLAINLFNYIDRQVLSAVLSKLELDADLFDPHDRWIGSKLGLLTTAFMVAYMLMSPVFGRLGDTRSRWALVGIGVIVWSLASGGSGLATGFVVLLLTRCLVGIGEAAYGPVAPAMLSDLYPERRRGQILAWFYAAIPVGSALGFVIGGQIADTNWGWRGAFQVVVLPGLVLGALCFFMKEPPRLKSASIEPFQPWRAVFVELRHVRSFVLCCAGMTCTTFVLGGVAAWAPYYIFEREARFAITRETIEKLSAVKDTAGAQRVPPEAIDKLRPLASTGDLTTAEFKTKLKESELTDDELRQYRSHIFESMTAAGSITLSRVNLVFGAIVVVSGLVATLFGGWLGDKLRDHVRGAYFLVAGYGAIVALPLYLAMLFVPFPYAWGFMFLAVFFLFINTGPANTILANVTRHRIRATAFAINILIIHMFGDAISPFVIGFIRDLSNLGAALLLVSVLILLAGILWVAGAKYLDEETRRVTAAETPTGPVNPVTPS
jgi:MFS family permease